MTESPIPQTTTQGGARLTAAGQVLSWSGYTGPMSAQDSFQQLVALGNIGTQKQARFSIDFSDDGLCVLTDVIKTDFSQFQNLMLSMGRYTSHDWFPTLGLEKLSIHGEEGGEVTFTCYYAGIASLYNWPPVEEVIVNMSQEKIELWKGFKEFSGLPDNPKDYVLTDPDTGEFRAFNIDSPSGMAGIDTILMPNSVLRRKWCQNAKPNSLAHVGKIYENLQDAPTINGLWICNGLTWTRRGLAYICTEDMMDTGNMNHDAVQLLYGNNQNNN